MNVLHNDLFDSEGRLLLPKNTRLTPHISKLLRKRGISLDNGKEKSESENEENEAQMKLTLQHFEKQVSQQSTDVFIQATEILQHIFSESKQQPWGLYCLLLNSYDDLLYSHSINVSLLSLMIAAKIHKSRSMLWKIGLGALLHDIGKLFIPISIVAKQRPLNPYETQVMKQHCELGEHVLTGRGLDTVCLKIVRQHHERLDGSGYPDGLRGSEIADEAKIVMIADSIDAITSYRPYKKAHSIAEAMKRLEKDSGQYDVKLFPVVKALFFNQ